jgi:hypothetical protein
MQNARVLVGVIAIGIIYCAWPGECRAQSYVGSCSLSAASNISLSRNSGFVFISRDGRGIASVNISDPANPIIADTLVITRSFRHIFLDGEYAYLTGFSTGLNIVNISNPDDLILISEYRYSSGTVHCSYIRGNIAYLTDCENFIIVDIADKANPITIAHNSQPQEPYGIWVEDNYAYLPNLGGSLFDVFDVTNPAQPILLASPAICPNIGWFLSSQNHYVYVPLNDYGLRVISTVEPTNPVVVDSIKGIGRAVSTFILDNYLFMASTSQGLFIYDISEPAHPVQVGSYSGISCEGVVANEHYIYLACDYGMVILSFDATSSEEEAAPNLDRPELPRNYPNPFNAQTTICYALAQAGPVTLSIYNIMGQKVATLFDGVQQAREHRVVWDAAGVTSGVYFYHLSGADVNETRKMILLR